MSDQVSLSERLGYYFSKTSLIDQAFTHRSASIKNNERLEFLGDSILNFTLTAELYRKLPEASEGDLSRIRASLVNGEVLAQLAHELELESHLKLGQGERKSGGSRRKSIQADAVEALFGAILLDGGIDACQSVIRKLYESRLINLPDPETLKDPKTRLQEYLQSRGLGLPQYDIVKESGKDHAKHFQVSCEADSKTYIGEGSSRRKAEQQAASTALAALLEDGE